MNIKLRVCFWCGGGKGALPCKMSQLLGGTHEEQYQVTILDSTSEETRKKYLKLRK